MKYLRQVYEEVKVAKDQNLQDLLWQLICYSPKMPARLHQQQLLDVASPSTLQVFDRYFSKSTLHFKFFKWGEGSKKILLTHGWGSKSIDFSELIKSLLLLEDVEIWAFDAPGNGSSEGELSNLFLFMEAIKQIENTFGIPDVMIGHSLGGMANVGAIQQTKIAPKLLISIAPLINLTENFKASMTASGVTLTEQQKFLNTFQELFGQSTEDFSLLKMYDFKESVNHFLLYDSSDQISPTHFIMEFLADNPEIKAAAYSHTTHAKIIIDPEVIAAIVSFIKKYI
ncbi:hypothetical protein ACVWYN_002407 [Pedobacter sp. UYP24]